MCLRFAEAYPRELRLYFLRFVQSTTRLLHPLRFFSFLVLLSCGTAAVSLCTTPSCRFFRAKHVGENPHPTHDINNFVDMQPTYHTICRFSLF